MAEREMTSWDKRLGDMIYFALRDEPWVPADQDLHSHLMDVIRLCVIARRKEVRIGRREKKL